MAPFNGEHLEQATQAGLNLSSPQVQALRFRFPQGRVQGIVFRVFSSLETQQQELSKHSIVAN